MRSRALGGRGFVIALIVGMGVVLMVSLAIERAW